MDSSVGYYKTCKCIKNYKDVEVGEICFYEDKEDYCILMSNKHLLKFELSNEIFSEHFTRTY